MNIGQASAESGVSAKMIRYYESVGLLPPAARSDAGYRRYEAAEVQSLRFLQRARSLGFSVPQMRDLMALWRDQNRASADVKRLALAHAAALDEKARALAEVSQALRHLANRCEGDHRPACPILDQLAEPSTDSSPARALADPAFTGTSGRLPKREGRLTSWAVDSTHPRKDQE